MRRPTRMWAAIAGTIIAVLPALVTPAAGVEQEAAVSANAWRAWLIRQQRAFVEDVRHVPLAVTLQISGEGGSAKAAVNLKGTVNADGTMLVSMDGPATDLTIMCSESTLCWARYAAGGPDRLWHRIPAREVGALRDPLPTQDAPLPDDAAYSIDRATGRAFVEGDDVLVQEWVSFANGAYHETARTSVPSEGVELSYSKSLTPAVKIATRAPRAALIGPPLGVDVIPQLP